LNEYGALEAYVQDIAQELGVAPAWGQSGSWSTIGRPKSFLDAIKDRMLVTMERRGMDGRETLGRLIDGTLPDGGLLTLVAAPGMLAYLLGQQRGEKQLGTAEGKL
jgi:hypothetical protein